MFNKLFKKGSEAEALIKKITNKRYWNPNDLSGVKEYEEVKARTVEEKKYLYWI